MRSAEVFARITAAMVNFLRGFVGVDGVVSVRPVAASCGHSEHRAPAASVTPAQMRAGLEARASQRRSCC